MAISNVYRTQYANIAKTPTKDSAEYQQTEKDAAQEYLDRLKAIDTRIQQVQALRDADSAGIRRNQDAAQRDINDQMFREYLANRERMGGRGVSNSGLMADAQIRLNANKQDRLADLYNQTQDKLSEVNRLYAPQQTELITERGGVRQSKIFQEMFDKMMERRAKEAQMVAPLMQNEFTNEQNRLAETFNRNERINRQIFDEKQNNANRRHETNLTTMRLKAEADQAALNRKSSADQAAADRQVQRDRLAWEKEQANLAKTEEGRKALIQEYNNVANGYQATADKIYEGLSSGNLKGTQYQAEAARFAREKNKEEKARNLAEAYASNNPGRINQALYEYNVAILKYDPKTGTKKP